MIYDKYPLFTGQVFSEKLKKNNEWCSSNGISQLQQALINSFGQDEDKRIEFIVFLLGPYVQMHKI